MSVENNLYVGSLLVAEDAFLRRLPVALDTKERMRFDAVVTASDLIANAFANLRRHAIMIGTDINKIDLAGRALMLSQCWTIVDQLHAIRQLLNPGKAGAAGEFTRAFLEASLPATELRHRMDHLANNLGNLASKRGMKAPLFGSLSYFYSESNPLTDGTIFSIMSGTIHGEQIMSCINPASRALALPADLFTLSAFDKEFELAIAIITLRALLSRWEEDLEDNIREQLKQQGLTEQELENAMVPSGGGIAIAVNCTF